MRAKNHLVKELKEKPCTFSFQLNELQELLTGKRGRLLYIDEEPAR